MTKEFVITEKYLELLVILDKERSFTHASEALGMNKMYAYQAISKLEKGLGVKITAPTRKGRGRNVKFTREGEAIVRDARFALHHIEKLMNHGGKLNAGGQ